MIVLKALIAMIRNSSWAIYRQGVFKDTGHMTEVSLPNSSDHVVVLIGRGWSDTKYTTYYIIIDD